MTRNFGGDMKRISLLTLGILLAGSLSACGNTNSDKAQAQELALKACGVTVGVDAETGEELIKSVDYGNDYSWNPTSPVDQILKVKNRDEERAQLAKRAERLDPFWNSLADDLQEMYEHVSKVWSIRENSSFPKKALTGTNMSGFYYHHGDSLPEADRYNSAGNRIWLECESLFASIIDQDGV